MNSKPEESDSQSTPANYGAEKSLRPEDTQAVELIKRALLARATELHADPKNGDVVIRFSIDGHMEHYCYLDPILGASVVAQFEKMADLHPCEERNVREGLLRLPPSLGDVQIRMTLTPVFGGEAMRLRLRERTGLIRDLNDLGFSEAASSSVRQMLARGSGIVVVAGPAGAGKTTTLYSLLAALDDGERKLATLEDPIAYVVPAYRQMAVDEVPEMTMAGGLAVLLRTDPDVIFVGELRDLETGKLVLQAAAAGKMVLTTLAGRDVASALKTLAELHGDRRTLTANLAGIIVQRLVRRLCQQCCERLRAGAAVRDAFHAQRLEPPAEVFRPIGCPRCRGTGFRDQLGLFEVAGPEHPVFEAFGRGTPEAEWQRTVETGPTGSLAADALRRVQEGVASFEAVKTVLADLPAPTAFRPEPQPAVAKTPRDVPARPRLTSGCRVVIFAAPDDPYMLREVFIDDLAMHPTDAMIRAHAAPGILPDQLTAEEAARWVAAISELGLHAEAVAAADVPDFGHAEVVHHLRCLDDGLEIIELHGEPEQRVRWSDIDLLSLGQVPQEVSRRYVMRATTFSAAHSTVPPPLDVPLPSGPELWVVCTDPLRGFRIDHKRMNYEYLGERKTDSATRNFRLFIKDLTAKATGAYRTPSTRAFLDHSSIHHYQFDSSEALRRYTVFHLLLRARLRQQQSTEYR